MSGPRVIEKRTDQRATLAFPVRIEVEGVVGASDFTAINISAGGVFVSTEHPYPVGTRLSLELKMPTLERPVQAEGIVVRCLPIFDADEGAAGMGIQLSEEGRIDWDFLDKLMEG